MSTSLIFVDSRLSLSADVLKNLPTNSRIITLNSSTDGLQQMADAVSAYQNLDSIHLISHGSAGALYVGNSVLNAQTLPNYSSTLSALGNSLSSTGDILLYGCNVAEGETGAAFINQLAQATGADVAASTNLTGQGGDWALEAQTGNLETAVLNAEGWQGQLAAERDFTVLTPPRGTGIVTTDLGGSDFESGNSLAVQADGKILLRGYSGISDFAVVRYNADGSLDTSFSGDGKLTTNLGGDDTVQADGKILLGGTSGGDFAIARYNPDGSLDTSFSGDGKLTTDLGSSDVGNSLTVQADGKILLGGSSGGNFAVARYNVDGSLDTSFSGDGKLTTDLGSSDVGNSLTVQADGKILLGGYSYVAGNIDFALVRYNPDGSLDTSFSDDGRLTIDLGSKGDVGQSFTVQADGKILLGGSSGGNFAVARYNVDGSLDRSFSGDGKLITDLGGNDESQSLTVQADGKILLMGSSTYFNGSSAFANTDFAVVRYNIDGSLDRSFSGDGKLVTDFGGHDYGYTLTVQADGKILLGGASNYPNFNSDFIVVRYNADGTLDASFGRNPNNNTPDEIYGDAGSTRLLNDALGGGNGVSDLYGLNGRDTLYGGNGDDNLYGGNGGDDLYGDADNDDMYGEQGNDKLYGDLGNDTLSGGMGKDSLYGGADNDDIYGEQGNDKLYGDSSNDTLSGGAGKDSLYGGDGNDVLDGSSDSDYMDGGNGADIYYMDNVLDTIRDSGTDTAKDTVYISVYLANGYTLERGLDNATLDALASNSELTGNTGQNELTGNDSDNSLNGGAGNDTLNGGVGSDTLNGGIGEDTLKGGAGDDVYVVDSVGDVVTESANAGSADTVQASVSYVLSTNVEKLVLSGREVIDGTGNRTDNTLIGNASKNQISGQAGNDILDAGGGNDTLIGGAGNDILTGGLGKDTFKLDALNESGLTVETRDVINDFRIGEDKIGLAGIDANANKTGDQAFTAFILSSKTFTAAGQLQFKNGVLYGNTDNDADAEFSIALTGITTLGMTDVIA